MTTNPRTLDVPLTDAQAAMVAHLVADLGVVVVIGSVHPRPYVAGMASADIGRLIARIGTVPRSRLPAIRKAALVEQPKAKRILAKPGTPTPTPGESTTAREASAAA